MSSSPRTDNSTASSAYRVNYSEYVADITGSPKPTRKSAATGIGHHINPLNNPNPSRQNQPIQQTGTMPQYGGGAEKCARCSKSVYLAEKKVGAGRSFHSSCFSCHTCKRKLDATTLSEHKGEIYCKSCYTKQFGAHGLISGVSMSTEKATNENRQSRRSSFGSDLDAPVITYQQTRPRANSNDNTLRDGRGTTKYDESSSKVPRRNDASPEQRLPINKKNNGLDAMVDTKYQTPSSPSGFERPVEQNTNNNRHRSTYAEEDDRSKYMYEGEKVSYGSGASAIVEIPVVVTYPKRSDSTFETPKAPTRDDQRNRSRSPSVTSNDSYRRENSRDRQTDFTDNYTRLSINEDNNNRKYSNDNNMNTIVSENPLSTRNNYHSSSSYEAKYKTTTSNTNNYDREQYHSRESSPTANRNRSPSPTIGFTSSSTTRTSSSSYKGGVLRDPTSPSSPYQPNHDYINTQTSTNPSVVNRRSPPPQQNERTSSTLTDFVSKTNLAKNGSPPVGGKNTILGALVAPRRRNDDDFDN